MAAEIETEEMKPPSRGMECWKRLTYIPQVDLLDEDDDQEQYMQMDDRPKKLPLIHVFLAFAVVIFLVVSLIYDEVSDGDVKLYNQKQYDLKEIDFDCGWESFYLSYKFENGYEESETYKYKTKSCRDYFEKQFGIDDFCTDMETAGSVWLACGIVTIIFSTAAIFAAFYQGKNSVIYFVCMFLTLVVEVTSVANWTANERCHDVEDIAKNSNTKLDTSIGVSQSLMYGAMTASCISLLLSSIFLIRKYRPRSGPPQQDSIQ